ncbi:hypothetical protein V5P93_006780 [Actinokineospora auranticolor]|uniref:Uncharacterized protein n=1 Tax=Actinokineospora auranticolor TaxID=155976 RepID=A0A2S6GWF9_9PSEU|nr:hypothetical protein [Actinokineospora auranticolor]PPK69575.1 hypothetical protein CLV40_103185 [Actinokineospora auranticolor]
MTGPNQGFADAVARFRAELDAAVTRARRASAEGRELSAAFRRDVHRHASRQSAVDEQAPRPVAPHDPDDDDFSQHQILFHGG